MSNEVFVWVNIGIGFLLVLLILVGKRGALKPSLLNLRKASGKKNVILQHQARDASEQNMKSLNVIFMFNGHSFDAYEVLGLPAGSRLEVVEKTYQEMMKNKPQDSEFFSAALSAIRQVRRS